MGPFRAVSFPEPTVEKERAHQHRSFAIRGSQTHPCVHRPGLRDRSAGRSRSGGHRFILAADGLPPAWTLAKRTGDVQTAGFASKPRPSVFSYRPDGFPSFARLLQAPTKENRSPASLNLDLAPPSGPAFSGNAQSRVSARITMPHAQDFGSRGPGSRPRPTPRR